jgi:CrcB protein
VGSDPHIAILRPEHRMFATFLIFLGGGIGAAMRHGVNVSSAQVLGVTYPWGTMIVNVV